VEATPLTEVQIIAKTNNKITDASYEGLKERLLQLYLQIEHLNLDTCYHSSGGDPGYTIISAAKLFQGPASKRFRKNCYLVYIATQPVVKMKRQGPKSNSLAIGG
jgi:hypothetical protein